VAASSRKFREATEADAAGVVFLLDSIGKPPRPRDQRMLRDIFLVARPPLLAVMQGGELRLIPIFSQLRMLRGIWIRAAIEG
jgi:hypothetical protein